MPIDKNLNAKATQIIDEWKGSRSDLKKKANGRRRRGTYVKINDILMEKVQRLANKNHIDYRTYLETIIEKYLKEK